MFRLLSLVLFVSLCAASTPVSAQQEQPAKSWDELLKVRTDSFARLREIQEAVQKVTGDQRQALAEEYFEIVKKMQTEVIPELRKQVPEKLAANPEDELLQEITGEIMRYDYQRNAYPEAKEMAAALLKANPNNSDAVNFSAVSSFAMHDFAEANRLLTLAKERGQLSQVGASYVDTSKSYIDYWKKEQEIRAKEAKATGNDQLPRVKLTTSQGEILIELFENEAPNTVANFISLVEKEYYNGLKFHRVIPGFMAQGGCPHSRDGDPQQPGSGGPGYSIECEAYRPDARRHFSGSLSMAHAGRDTGGSQFFITHLPTAHLDREINPQSVHTVFGRVVEGLDVARSLQPNAEIVSAEVVRKRDHEYKPETIPER